MHVFITGATGVLGRRVVDLLVAGGHSVAGLSRSPANTAWLSAHGAEARPGDLFDRDQMLSLAAGAQAVLHLATAIPTKARTTPADWALNDRIRRAGTANLVEAALRNQARLYVQQSITFLYGHRDGDWVDEHTPLPARLGGVLQSALDMEQTVQEAARERGLPAVVLRFGTFYSADSAQTASMLEALSRRAYPVIGGGEAYWNLIHVDDAARAVAQTVDNYANRPAGLPDSGQVFNICDDAPVRYRDLMHALASMLGARPPSQLPAWLARLLLGKGTVNFLLASARCRNQLAREVLGWQPRYPSHREGFAAEIEKWRQQRS